MNVISFITLLQEHRMVSFLLAFDKMVAAFTIATGAAATNREVTMFLPSGA